MLCESDFSSQFKKVQVAVTAPAYGEQPQSGRCSDVWRPHAGPSPSAPEQPDLSHPRPVQLPTPTLTGSSCTPDTHHGFFLCFTSLDALGITCAQYRSHPCKVRVSLVPAEGLSSQPRAAVPSPAPPPPLGASAGAGVSGCFTKNRIQFEVNYNSSDQVIT